MCKSLIFGRRWMTWIQALFSLVQKNKFSSRGSVASASFNLFPASKKHFSLSFSFGRKVSTLNICINRSLCHHMGSKCLAFVADKTRGNTAFIICETFYLIIVSIVTSTVLWSRRGGISHGKLNMTLWFCYFNMSMLLLVQLFFYFFSKHKWGFFLQSQCKTE